MPKVVFCMIVFNSDFVLGEVLRSILPFAHKVIIVEGPVKYWQENTIQKDETRVILSIFKGHEKIKVIDGQWKEKTEMCQAFMPHVPEDTDYIWCIDADEVFIQSFTGITTYLSIAFVIRIHDLSGCTRKILTGTCKSVCLWQ